MEKLMNDKYTPDPFLTTLGLARRAGKLILGWDRISEYSGHISFCITSNDAAERTVLNAQKRAETIHVDYSMEVLGSALGVKKVAVVAVTDDGFAELLKKKMKNN